VSDSELIQRYLVGQASQEDLDRLNAKTCDDPAFRQRLAQQIVLDCSLREIASEEAGEPVPDVTPARFKSMQRFGGPVLAASLVFLAGWVWLASRPDHVATIIKSEGAAWVSDLPTSVGSALPPGELQLSTGIATLRFDSGALMVLEAPARVQLLTPMHAHLHQGAAVLTVPDEAIGFVLATPSGDAIDLGTSFAVHVNESDQTSEFEVLEGSISVGTPESARRVTLLSEEAVVVDGAHISTRSTTESAGDELPIDSPIVNRVGTNGRESTFIRGNKHFGTRKPDVLLVKSSWSKNLYDRKAVFEIDPSVIEPTSFDSVRLRLNQVESKLGFASRLPPISVFSVYAMLTADVDKWEKRTAWEEAPAPEDGVLVGEFEIPRSRVFGDCVVETEALKEFIREHHQAPITFVVVRKTKQIPGEGRVLVHAFASSKHASAVGPSLEWMTTRESF